MQIEWVGTYPGRRQEVTDKTNMASVGATLGFLHEIQNYETSSVNIQNSRSSREHNGTLLLSSVNRILGNTSGLCDGLISCLPEGMPRTFATRNPKPEESPTRRASHIRLPTTRLKPRPPCQTSHYSKQALEVSTDHILLKPRNEENIPATFPPHLDSNLLNMTHGE